MPVQARRFAASPTGMSLRRLLEADYAAHPETYGPEDGKPGDPFFHRRARNLFTYARNNGRLRLQGPPRLGDVVFLSRRPQGMITHVAQVSRVEPDGRYAVIELSPDPRLTIRDIGQAELLQRGWLIRGFGDVPLDER